MVRRTPTHHPRRGQTTVNKALASPIVRLRTLIPVRDGYALVETPYLGMEHQGAIAYGNHYRPGYDGYDPPGLTAGAIEQLLAHTFPGNVRELKNIIERALIESGGREIGVGQRHIPWLIRIPPDMRLAPERPLDRLNEGFERDRTPRPDVVRRHPRRS